MGLSFVQMSITGALFCFFCIGAWVGGSPMIRDGFQRCLTLWQEKAYLDVRSTPCYQGRPLGTESPPLFS